MVFNIDTCRAFLPYPAKTLRHHELGPLSGLTLAVKDLFDVRGYPTGAGNPLVLAASGVKTRTAPLVQALLGAGARFLGKTCTDEFAYSMTGRNVHFGTPLNPAAPTRLPGGSSSGSASAVAGGLADIGLGSDTGGSIRAPASYCGLYGIRPTHKRLSLKGVWPMAPSFDTPGWFATNPLIFGRVADVVLGGLAKLPGIKPRWIVATDALALAEPATVAALRAVIGRAALKLGPFEERAAFGDTIRTFEAFRHLQAYEAWQSVGDIIAGARPPLGPPIAARFAFAETLTETAIKPHLRWRTRYRKDLLDLLGNDGVIVAPVVPSPAPLLTADEDALQDHRVQAQRLLSPSGMAGTPQVVIPATTVDGAPVGIGLMGPRNSDRWLVGLAGQFASAARLRMAG
jgi:amidase